MVERVDRSELTCNGERSSERMSKSDGSGLDRLEAERAREK